MLAKCSRVVWLVAVCLGVVLLATSCQAAENGGTADSPLPANVEALYARMDTSIEQYREGLDALRAGDIYTGRRLLETAIDQLALAGTQCTQVAGCETQRFMASYHYLLTQRSAVLTGAAEDFVEFEHAPPLVSEGSPGYAQPDLSPPRRWLEGENLADLIELNSLVRYALHDWLTWMRPTLLDAYENYQFKRHLMAPYYHEAGLPEALLFGILAKESGGRVHSVSRAGAAGPLQFMYHTGLRFGLTTVDDFDQRFDPAASTRANVAYLQERFAQLDGNLELALAAYNGGENRILRLIRGRESPNFWDPEIFRQLPRETQEYVPSVLAAALIFMDPEAYGVQFPVVTAPPPGRIILQNAMTLSELAVCLGQEGSRNGWFRSLRNLNARAEHDIRLRVGTTIAVPQPLEALYAQHCLEGSRLALARELHASRDERRALLATRVYTVRDGDTLSTIASAQGCSSASAIAEANGIAGPRYLIRAGQEIKLVGCRL